MDNIEITKAETSDLEDILNLQRLSFQENAVRYNDNNISPLTQTLEELEEEAKTHIILKAVFDGKIIGSVRGCMVEDYAYLGRLFVHPDYQNRGIARMLMAAIEDEFNTDKFELVVGHLDDKNIALYRKLGFIAYKEEKISENLYFIHMKKQKSGE